MKKLKSIVGVMIVLSVALISSTALADTVTVNGQTFRCTNQCVVHTFSNGDFTVTDCCGGRVSGQLPNPQ